MDFLNRCLLLLGALSVLANGAPQAASRPTVTVANGVVVGTTTTAPSATAVVNKFLGIPFAKPPTGALRFQPPKPAARWSKPLDASKLSSACFEQFNSDTNPDETKAIFDNPTPPQSEDCLYLNVFTPASAAPKEGRAVLFWIYGGNLQFGSSNVPYYDGSSFAANQNIILVTTNYRTNVFGFSGSPQIPQTSQNAGFYDQRLALQWVHNNIAAFGGNKDKITIFGESAGGYSVKQLLALPPSPLPYAGAIMESEAVATEGSGAMSWEQLAGAIGCGISANQLQCVQSKPARQVQNIIQQNSLAFPPVADGVTRVTDVSPSINAKTFAGGPSTPFFIGTNADEGRVFAAILGLDQPGANATSVLESAYLGNNAALLKAIEASYGTNDITFETASEVITDLVFQCPAKLLSNLAVQNGYQVWRYYYNASFPNLEPPEYPNLGAFHSSEIPQVFGTYNDSPKGPSKNAQQIALSKYMQTAWANFAKNPKAGPGWVKLGSAAKDVGDLGGNRNHGEYDIAQSSIDGKCVLYDAVIVAEGL